MYIYIYIVEREKEKEKKPANFNISPPCISTSPINWSKYAFKCSINISTPIDPFEHNRSANGVNPLISVMDEQIKKIYS